MAGREAKLQSKIIKELKSGGHICWKQPPVKVGFPDIFSLYGGKLYCIEVKDLGKKPTMNQENMIRKLKSNGARAFWVDSWELFLEMKDTMDGNWND